MAETAGQHLLQQFYADIATTGERLLLIAKEGIIFHRITKRHAAAEISRFIRALHANGITAETRVTFQGTADHLLWVAEWGVLANRCVAVIVPHDFSTQELLDTLAESKSKLAIVDKLVTAEAIANASARVPDLKHILCFEGEVQAALPILSWDRFIDSGEKIADRSATILRSITAKDTAILFYYKDESNSLQAMRYTHALLLSHAQKIDTLLGGNGIQKGDVVLTATPWEHVTGHIVSYYLPVLKEATSQIADGRIEPGLFENHPHVIIGKGAYFDDLKQYVIESVKQWGLGEQKELDMALALGKLKYEAEKLNLWQRLGYAMLLQTIVKKITKLLGGKLRLIVSVDDTVHYETQLFFETFGIELVELPPDILK